MNRHTLLSGQKTERKYSPQQKLYPGAEWFLRTEYRKKYGSAAHKITLIEAVGDAWKIEGGGSMDEAFILDRYIHP